VKKEVKGKGKAMRIAVPEALARTPKGSRHQQKRQAVLDVAKAGVRQAVGKPALAAVQTPARTILKRPEMVAEEEKKREGRLASKVAARVRWKSGDLGNEKWDVYTEAANPILALDAQDDEAEKAAKAVSHMAGMRAVEDLWEEQQASPPERNRAAGSRRSLGQPPAKRPQPGASQQQQQQKQQQQQTRDPTGLEPTKRSLPWDERAIAFERGTGAPQIDPEVAANAAAQVNIALSKVTPPHIRTEAFKISAQGRLTTAAQAGASAAMLLHFKKEVIEAARRADKAIINVVANETWAELKILVPYAQYRHASGLADLWEWIEAENEGVVIPPFSIRWMRSKKVIEQHFQDGRLPQNAASVSRRREAAH